MEVRQFVYIAIGLGIFVSVIYLSSHSKGVIMEMNIIKLNEGLLKLEPKLKQMPNFVFILTDDQDSVLGGAQHMPHVRNHIIKNGITFKNSFVTSPLCCPSRSSILTGQYVHNHLAINNSMTGGCSSKSWQKGPEKKTFVNILHQNGYQTFFAGKYLNQYGNAHVGGLTHVPPGWDWWIGLEGNSKYYNYNISVNGTVENHGEDPAKDYLTNLIRNKSLEFLNIAPSYEKPFFIMLSTPACHAPFTAEPKYANEFNDIKAPRTSSFNIVNDMSKHWLLRLGEQPLREELVNKIDDIARKRLRTILSVDDLVESVVLSLADKDLLNSTYIVFMSDNGYHLGQFSMPLDKREPYETDIRVPFYISGPDIQQGIIYHPATNIDLAPTILHLAGIDLPKYFDGESLKPLIVLDGHKGSDTHHYSVAEEVSDSILGRTILIEHTGEGREVNRGCEHLGPNLSGCNSDFDCKCQDSFNNTYACLRHISKAEDFLYCLWENDSFEEYYSLDIDRDQVHNTINSLPVSRRKKLKFLLNNFQKCKGAKCEKLSKFIM